MCQEWGIPQNPPVWYLLSYLAFFFISDELKNFFSKYGKVMEHQIIRDHETNRSRGFGFVIFDNEEVVDELLSKGNMIDMAGTQVSLFEWYPRSQNVNTLLAYMDRALLNLRILSIEIIYGNVLFSVSCSFKQITLLT